MSDAVRLRRQISLQGMAGAVFAFLAVALGAFGAHYLKTRLSSTDLGVYHTAVEYQMFHALALLWVVLFARTLINAEQTGLAERQVLRCLIWAARFFVFGIILFCGSLYLLVATQVKGLGAITPLGGVAFLLGWASLVLAFKQTFSLSDKET